MKDIILLIFIFLIPLGSKTQVWFNLGGGINIITIFLLVTFMVAVGSKRHGKPLFPKSNLNGTVLIFITLLFISVLTGHFNLGTPLFGAELHEYKRFITPFILFFITGALVSSEKTMKKAVAMMLFMVFLMALFTIKEHGTIDLAHYSKGARFHIMGMQPNNLGAFFAQYIPIAAAIAMLERSFRKKIIPVGIFAVGAFALMFTYSRGAYLSAIAAMGIIALASKKRLVFGFAILSLIIAVVVGPLMNRGPIIPTSVKERFTSIAEERKSDKSITRRQDVWDIAWEEIKAKPLTGSGYGSSKYVIPMDTHNMYLDIALDAGLPALAIFVILLLQIFLMGRAVFKEAQEPFQKAMGLALMATITAIAVGNLFGTRLDLFSSNGYFAILLGITARVHSDLKYKPELEKTNKGAF